MTSTSKFHPSRWAAVCGLFLAGAAQANYIDGQGREWLDMAAVNGYSWTAIDAVCQSASETAGACSGLLGGSGGYDLSGWTWASRAEVVGLIDGFMVSSGDASNTAGLQSQNGYGTQNFAWAQAIITAMGQTASAGPNDQRVIGYMNGTDTVGFTTTGQQAFICTGSPCGFTSYAGAGVSAGVARDKPGSGWFYRTPSDSGSGSTNLPEPGSLALVGLALATGVGALRRRRG